MITLASNNCFCQFAKQDSVFLNPTKYMGVFRIGRHTSVYFFFYKLELAGSSQHGDSASGFGPFDQIRGSQLFANLHVTLQDLVGLVAELPHEQNLVNSRQFVVQIAPRLVAGDQVCVLVTTLEAVVQMVLLP